MRYIPLSKPEITNEDRKAVLATLKTPSLSLGSKLQEFEKRVASYVGRRYAVAVNSGTSALHLIIKSLGITKGDEVITTPFSFIASANCILFEGATPVFADIDPKTLTIDPKKIKSLITKHTKAILAVDIFGQPADWDDISNIAKEHKLYTIEDSCEAIGSEYKKRKCGSFGQASVFSFYPNKQMTTGEGGILVTDKKTVFELARSLRNQGRDEHIRMKRQKRGGYRSWLSHIRLGYNYRISEMNCALGISQLARLEKTIRRRARIVAWYNALLANHPSIKTPLIAPYTTKISWMHYVIQLTDRYTQKERDTIIEELRRKGIQTSNYFPSIHLQPFYKTMFVYKKGMLPVSEYVSERVIALPLHNMLTRNDVLFISNALKRLLL